jgi:hypothetical protein
MTKFNVLTAPLGDCVAGLAGLWTVADMGCIRSLSSKDSSKKHLSALVTASEASPLIPARVFSRPFLH